MHELSLMKEFVEILEDLAAKERVNKVYRIKLSVGQKSHVDDRALSFAFDSFSKSSQLLTEAKLQLDRSDGDGVILEWFEGE